jgi:hypothetical protein
MLVMRIILLNKNHSDGVIRGCEVEEIITTVIEGEEKWSMCQGQFQSFEGFVCDGIPYELRPLFEESHKSKSYLDVVWDEMMKKV